jgi:glyoxylase-like metal-dependent hydrolase (beta-lactamase superfamily II)
MGLLDRLRLGGKPAELAVRPEAATTGASFAIDLARVRRLATLVPGPLPIAINGTRVAASIRPRKFVIEGGDDTPVTMPRTAYQLVYPDGTLMLDAGLDKATHDSFSPDKPEPYFAEAFAVLRAALDRARMIVLTHFHADHVAGVVTAPNFTELAAKSLITAATARAMMETPHRPHLKLAAEQITTFNVVEYDKFLAVAPGLVLIEAPGHSPDMQMAYIRLQSGREILHSIDAAWNLDNIRQIKGKAAPWVKEDVPRVLAQLAWLNDLMRREPNILVLVTHDNEQFEQLTTSGIVGPLVAS